MNQEVVEREHQPAVGDLVRAGRAVFLGEIAAKANAVELAFEAYRREHSARGLALELDLSSASDPSK